MIVGSEPERAVQWSLAVDTQRVVREAEGKYAVFLRWRGPADSLSAPRTDRIERHLLNCPARQTTYHPVHLAPIQGDKKVGLVSFADPEVKSAGFPSEGPEREFFEGSASGPRRPSPAAEGGRTRGA